MQGDHKLKHRNNIHFLSRNTSKIGMILIPDNKESQDTDIYHDTLNEDCGID